MTPSFPRRACRGLIEASIFSYGEVIQRTVSAACVPRPH